MGNGHSPRAFHSLRIRILIIYSYYPLRVEHTYDVQYAFLTPDAKNMNTPGKYHTTSPPVILSLAGYTMPTIKYDITT